MSNDTNQLLPYSTIVAAAAGDTDALITVRDHYRPLSIQTYLFSSVLAALFFEDSGAIRSPFGVVSSLFRLFKFVILTLIPVLTPAQSGQPWAFQR